MVNFNGQLKKRSVNLGGGFKNNRSNIILQNQREREKREQERLKEKQVITIQKSIRKFNDLSLFRTEFSANWEINDNINQTIFAFNSFYPYIFRNNSEKLIQIEKLRGLLISVDVGIISQSNINGLFKTVTKSIEAIDSPDDFKILDCLLKIAKLIQHRLLSSKFEIIPILSKFAFECYKESSIKSILETINLYSFNESKNYIKFISSPIIIELTDFSINYELIANTQEFDLSRESKLQLLSNLISKRLDFTTDVIIAISNLISSIHVALMTRTEKHFENEKINPEVDDNYDDTGDFETKIEIITEELNQKIDILYSTEFITTASRLLEPHRASLLYGSLINLKPSMKSSLIIHLIPRTFEPLLRSILSNSTFTRILNMKESSFFNISNDLIKEIFIDEAQFLLYDLSIFLQLLQYRLITSNDFEIFKGYDFTIEKFKQISIFLKHFVFNFIWNYSKITNYSKINPKYADLKKLSVNVLNQIYLKNSRINVLNNDIWLLETFDLSNLVPLIVRNEDFKNDNDGYNSDDDSTNKIEYFLGIDAASQARLEIFKKTPFFISFDKRVEIFQILIKLDKEKSTQMTGIFFNPFSDFLGAKEKATIRREHLLEDAYESFNKIGTGFKNPLKIQFVNEHGTEEGIDGGGITKEFLSSVVKDAIGKDFFIENSQHELYPNPKIAIEYQNRINSEEQLKKLNYIRFFGKVVGKCLYEAVLVDMNFASFFLMKLNSNFKNSFDDLKSMDSELHSNLVKLLQLPEDELDSLSLTFSLDEKIGNKTISVDLIPNGSMIPVSVSNRLKFTHEVSKYKLNKTMNLQSNYFLSGLYEMISKEWLTMFNPYELQLLISGENDIDVKDLKEHTCYGGFLETSETIVDLWEIVEEMSSHDKFQFVKFVTSVPKAPLLGFKVLNPNFGITNSGDFPERLPTSSTCVNLLKLPNYRNKELLREKLLYAINAEARFDLS